MPVPISQTLTLTSSLVPKEESNMPFIDDELLWCPDNDGKMVDLTQCLQVIELNFKKGRKIQMGSSRIQLFHLELNSCGDFRCHTSKPCIDDYVASCRISS